MREETSSSGAGFRRGAVWGVAAAVVVGLVYLMATAHTGPVDPTEVAAPQSRATIVFNSAAIVFREGRGAVLLLPAVPASPRGATASRRRPMAAGAGLAFVASVATWFDLQAVMDVASPL